MGVTWTEPTAVDDSGSVVSTSTSNPGDSFSVGTTTVIYTFGDAAGNSAICAFTVTVSGMLGFLCLSKASYSNIFKHFVWFDPFYW